MAFYSAAFSEKCPFVDEALSDNSIDVLSLVRNIIVHKARIADEIYVRDSSNIKGAPILTKGVRLELDSKLVSNMIRPVVANCEKLIN